MQIRTLLSILLLLYAGEGMAQLSYLQWVFGMGGPGNNPSYVNETHTIHTGPGSEITIGGWAAGTIDLDPSPSTFNVVSPSPTIFNGFFALYDSSSKFLRGYVLSCTSDSYVENVARDPAGMITISGEFIGSLDADPGAGVLTLNSLAGSRDMYIAKYDTSGTPLFAFAIGGDASADQLNRMICDSVGNIYITGSISDTVDFDPGPGQTVLNGTPGESMFLAKYNGNGQLQWAFIIDTSPLPQRGYSLAFAPNGDLIVAMGFRGLIDADPSTATANFAAVGAGDLLIARYNPAGAYVNAWQMGGPGGVSISETSVDCDGAGNILLAARFSGNLDVDPGPGTTILSSQTPSSVLVGRYSSTGQLQWALLPGLSHVGFQSAELDPQGNAYVLTFDVISSGLLSKFDGSGSLQYTKNIVSTSGLVPRALHVKGKDSFLIGGGIKGSGTIDGTFFGAGSGYGAFLSQFGACLIPDISAQSGSTDVCDSADVLLNVTATGTGISYQWYRNGQALAGDTTSQLWLNAVDSTDSGAYTCVVNGLCGADTTSSIQINVNAYPQLSIQLNGNQLQALPAGLSQYIWLNNNQPTGVTGPVYSNPPTGIYAVIGINAAGCADTSALVAITSLEKNNIPAFKIYPNPAKDKLFIALPAQAFHTLEIRSITGSRLKQIKILDQQSLIETDISGLASGVYMIYLIKGQDKQLTRLVIE